MRQAKSRTRTTPVQQTTETGSLDLTEPILKTLNASLVEEAKEFKESRFNKQPDTITPRILLAGLAMSAMIATGKGSAEYIKRESFEWADYMLNEN